MQRPCTWQNAEALHVCSLTPCLHRVPQMLEDHLRFRLSLPSTAPLQLGAGMCVRLHAFMRVRDAADVRAYIARTQTRSSQHAEATCPTPPARPAAFSVSAPLSQTLAVSQIAPACPIFAVCSLKRAREHSARGDTAEQQSRRVHDAGRLAIRQCPLPVVASGASPRA